MIISISGNPGSGKSTIAKMLAEKLGYKRYDIGGLRRQMAARMGITLEELNRLGEKEFFTDGEVDRYQKELGEKEDNFVIEGRTSYFFIPHSIKIFLDVDEREGARRIFQDIQNGTQRYEAQRIHSLQDVLKANRERKESDRKRYQKYYQQDVFDPRHYDLIIDTTHLSQEEVFQKVYQFVLKKQNQSKPDFSPTVNS